MNGISSRTALLFVGLLCATAATSQTVQGLELDVHTPHRSVPIDSALTLNVTLRNTRENGRIPLGRMPDWTDNGGLTLYVLGANGSLEPLAAPRRAVSVPAEERQLQIEAGNAISLRRTVRISDLARAPGEYKIVVEYRPDVGGARSVVSAPVTVKVLPARAP